ncbi:MAG: hypothetical protein ABIV39_13335, partial [Verrucomicrobiota bacterium]
MKIQTKSNAGSALVVTMLTTGLICLYIGSYLSMISNEDQLTKRSQNWNAAIPVAEAGVEEAMAHLQATFPTLKAAGGWSFQNEGVCLTKRNDLSTNEYYVVGIFPPVLANGIATPLIVSQGFVRAPNSTNFISRTIRVETKLESYSMPGMVVVTTAVMNGNTLALDSFNSTNAAFSTNGKYDVAKRGDKAYLATLSNKTG